MNHILRRLTFNNLIKNSTNLQPCHYISKQSRSQNDIHTKDIIDRKDVFHKSVLNESGHKNVFKNNYRIAATLIGVNKNKEERRRIRTEYEAKQFVKSLTPSERLIIKDELLLDEQHNVVITDELETESNVQMPSAKQLLMVCLQSGVPFIGFGFVDNFVMIIAGDAIESYIGVFLPISTLAAAGLGNAISDVGGVGLAHHIEYYSSKIIQAPKLTPEQWSLGIVGWCNAISKSFCIFIGCLIGMTPLLFINHEEHEKKNEKSV